MTAGGSGTTQCSYDAAGNLIFDGAHAYQYDAWQRLVQVSRAAPLLANSLADPNEPILFEVGAMVRGFTYDGVGRLVRTVSPWPTPEMPSGEVRVERYFFDDDLTSERLVTTVLCILSR